MSKPAQNTENLLLSELSQLIQQSRHQLAAAANSTLTMLFWQVGRRINEHVLQNKRAQYGKEIVSTLSTQLEMAHGHNFTEKNLRRMMQFASLFPDFEIVVTLSRQFTWSHFLTILPIKNVDSRLFYAQKSIAENWGVRELRQAISKKEFERCQIAQVQLLPEILNAPNTIFKDPYILDFLKLNDDYLEKDLEAAILKELELFILEMGRGFAFVERQKRMIIDGEDFHLDLLFFHRKLRRLVAIDLKIGKFQAKDKGQMELYLKWLDRYDRQDGEENPIGLILCAESSREQVELLEMHKDGIMVAEYWTELPPKKELEQRLHQILIEAREQLERRKLT
jgi:predicted nuclease of restriction endonuclease-like (RecB) superfamily